MVKPSSCAFSQHSSYSIIVQTPLPSLSLLDYLITEEASTHRLPQRMQKSHGFLFFVCIMCITGVCSCEYRTIEAMMHSWRSEDNLRCWSLPSTLRRGSLVHCVHQSSWPTDFQGSHQALALQVCTACLALCGLRGSELRSHICKISALSRKSPPPDSAWLFI